MDATYEASFSRELAEVLTDIYRLESKAKELYTDMPINWGKPTASRAKPETGIYECLVYNTQTGAGE